MSKTSFDAAAKAAMAKDAAQAAKQALLNAQKVMPVLLLTRVVKLLSASRHGTMRRLSRIIRR